MIEPLAIALKSAYVSQANISSVDKVFLPYR